MLIGRMEDMRHSFPGSIREPRAKLLANPLLTGHSTTGSFHCKSYLKGEGVRGEGRGVRDEGRGVRDEWRGVRDEGRGVRDEGRGARGEG